MESIRPLGKDLGPQGSQTRRGARGGLEELKRLKHVFATTKGAKKLSVGPSPVLVLGTEPFPL